MNQPVLLFLLSELDRVTGAIREHVTGGYTGLTLDDGQVDRLLKRGFQSLQRAPDLTQSGPGIRESPEITAAREKAYGIAVNVLTRKPRSDKGKPRGKRSERGAKSKALAKAMSKKRGWPKGKKRGPRKTAAAKPAAETKRGVARGHYRRKAAVKAAKLVQPRPHPEPKIHDVTPQEARAV